MVSKTKTFIFALFVVIMVSSLEMRTLPSHKAEAITAPKVTSNIVKAKNGDCYAPRQVTDQGVCACPDRKNYVPERNECVCPKYAPFWNGQYCSGCPPGMDFNLDLGICYVCPEGFTRGYKIMTCMPGLLSSLKSEKLPADKA